MKRKAKPQRREGTKIKTWASNDILPGQGDVKLGRLRAPAPKLPPHLAAILSVSLLVLVAGYLLDSQGSTGAGVTEENDAFRLMAERLPVIARAREQATGSIDRKADPNHTGLIGVEWSDITTTLGDLAAKRTTTNPEMASLITRMLAQAGVKRGSVIAIGASSSFPSLILATLCAAEALQARPIMVLSLGSSTWGANDPRFTWIDVQLALRQAGLPLPGMNPAMLLEGGDDDGGAGLASDGLHALAGSIERRGFAVVNPKDLAEGIEMRITLYRRLAGGRPIAAFVNVGGAAANLGPGPECLAVKPGLNRSLPAVTQLPAGVMFRMAREGVPVIHLLNVKSLAVSAGLPVDPVPLPDRPHFGGNRLQPVWWALAALYLVGWFAAVGLRCHKQRLCRRTDQLEQ